MEKVNDRLCPYCRRVLLQPDKPTWRRLTDAIRRLLRMRDRRYREDLGLPISGMKGNK